MTSRPNTDNYLDLFLNDIPMMDVRAPIEFNKGSFPHTVNEPLMNDEERHLVGIRYKQQGQDSAIELGNELVCGDTKAKRIEQWLAFTQKHPEGYLYCFRGGLRSRTTQQWLSDAGTEYPLITGGYKAMRRFLIDQLLVSAERKNYRIISGRTGTGKTRLLKRTPNYVDLEGLANHRGSSFGRQLTPQPSQIDFENALSIELLKARHLRTGPVYIEDESRLIGRNAVPQEFRDRSTVSDIVLLEAPLEERIDMVLQDYVIDMTNAYKLHAGEEEGFNLFSEYLLNSVARIQKRLGGEQAQHLQAIMHDALKAQQNNGSLERHKEWIQTLLSKYYDPMYDFQLSKKADRIIFRGDQNSILDWIDQGR
ncbi:tRNA 2-selenouridine(34) synthase MnmH [Alkalimarinus sediminis]|uniref:tRNA 2-selenouridine synthase n=1 Tax=Alkalimarinus sediminis TaxID=1632866 RepID=A0A9E8HIJ4_9ALTE|nr:tRNA 2-selenouridine(34) synthase MnmH [Alkalimarinus sediminis]UZW73992.1 tRNA 2-selenouridine(34) synthase MnmH [Alkalimarinus sediminis]